MLRGARYINLLDHFQPLLDSWYLGYTQMSCPSPARKILLVDYYYARMYIRSIAIQALVERISNLGSGADQVWQDHEILQSKHAQGFTSIKEVRESSGRILTIAVELCNENLRHYCPVRLYLRIVSASVFLLKSISLGSREAEIVASLKTLDRCIAALQTNYADDIHLSTRYAKPIARHVQRFKRNFRVKKRAFVHAAMASPYRSRASSPFSAGNNRSRGAQPRVSQYGLVDQHQQQQDQFQPHLDQPPASQHRPSYATASTHAHDEQLHGPQRAGDGLSTGQLPAGTIDLSSEFNFGEDESTEDWLAQPFNPQIAPFGQDFMQPGAGLAVDSLDFLSSIQS
ncbi:hypothetical protein HRR78_006086 [Exophiala dermatitidis]|nr:hypothetical protein HRR75_006155 [Exophiala dermatitidis]KAJ4545810.1 hypothetical protein HRR78_006086 [Exophiala dermatitidis]